MAKARKFNAFSGVFTPSILTILGVIMYLRLPWIVGQAGLLATLGIILVAHIISGSTGLSVASIATDKKVESGGTYFMISRSLGLPIGGTLGWALFVGLSFSVSLYLIGFAEVFLGYFGFEVNITTIRIAGSIILMLVTVLTFISTSLAIKTQYIILAAMILSLLSVFFGKHEFSPTLPQLEMIPESLPWIALFAIFFPAVTGFEAGVSMSGDLKDPRKDIPYGTILAILVGLAVYVGLAFFFSFTVSSNILVSDPNVLFAISLVPQLVIAGILGATLSSALGSILGAPRILQAVAKDRIAPLFFSKGFGVSNEPRNALLLTFIIAQAGILIGELNVIARIVTIFFIITYGFLNITYAVESWASSDFRPSFKIPRFVSIIGAIACIIVMIQLDILAMAVASLVLISLFFYLKKKELNLQTGDTRSSIWLSIVKTGLIKLTKSQTTSRNWRPNVILFSGGAKNRPHLIEIGEAIVGKLGIFTNFELIEHPDEKLLIDKTAIVTSETIGEHTNVLTRKHGCRNIYEGIELISRVYGFSGFEPNTILMGWAKNTRDPIKFKELLINLRKLNYNLTFLSYDKNSGFGKYKKIDFWWSGKGRNLSLALHLIRFITATPIWRHAEIRILAISPGSKNTERYYAMMSQIVDNYRIRANVKVISNPGKLNEKDIILSESNESDLCILEIPQFTSQNSDAVIAHANELTEVLNSCLLIQASTLFEEVNIISEVLPSDKQKYSDVSDKKPLSSFIDKLQLSDIDIVHNEVYNLAQILEKQSGKLIDNTFYAITEKHDSFIDQLNLIANKVLERLFSFDQNKDPQETHLQYLKIVNDFSYHVQKLITEFITDNLNNEKDIISNGFTNYLTETENSLNKLPQYIRLMFGIEDYKNLKSDNLFIRISKAAKILYLSMYSKKVSYKINILPAAFYYLYYKKLKYFRDFFNEYPVHSISGFVKIKEYLYFIYETIENAKSGKLSHNEIHAMKEISSDLIAQLKKEKEDFIYGQVQKFVVELTNNLQDFSKIIESPRANSLSRRFKSHNRKKVNLEQMLADAPDLWYQYMVNNVNKTSLDFMYLALKNRINTKIARATHDIEILIEGHILSKLRDFESQIKLIQKKGELAPRKKEVFSPKLITQPQVNELFTSLSKEIRELVEELPENIEIAGNEILDGVQFEDLENSNEFIVSVRKTADFYISNELSDQIKKQSLSLENQMSSSIIAIKDLIRLANFNLDNNGNSGSDEREGINTEEQQKAFIEELLEKTVKEEQKLHNFISQLKHSLLNALENAFDPLSSSIIIKTSTNLSRKIRETDKREFSGRVRNFFNSISRKIDNQFVNLLYRQSEGLLWADRMEHLKQKAILYPGEHINEILSHISPDKMVIQQLPFYYSSLFSGGSSIGEDFWVGMEDEIEKGDKAIKRFLHGTSGLLIITGERSSGKSSLSKHLANLHFSKDEIHSIRAPRESLADSSLFEQTMIKSLNGQDNMDYCLEALPSKSVIIINDLELWWERKPFGTQVIEKIISLVRQFGQRILFIVNVNVYALKIIDQLSAINTWALDLIFCQPFDARELRNLIMIRHQAGGMKLVLDKRQENEMTNWDFARLFNRFFNLSSGNPGYALNLWLAGIKKLSGNSIYIEKPVDNSIIIPERLDNDELLFILQFILHRRFSVKSLSEILQNDIEGTEKTIRILLQKGILVEKFPGVYSLNPALEIHLVKKLKSLELL